MEEENGSETRKSKRQQEIEKRRQRDRDRRKSMTAEQREKHLARRRRNYFLRRQKAEIIPSISLVEPVTGTSSDQLDVESDQSVGILREKMVKLMGPIRLSRVKHLARTLNRPSTCAGAKSSIGEDSKTRCALSSGLRLTRLKRLIRSNGQQEGLSLQQAQT